MRVIEERPTLRGVIFDMDGVIIDSHPIHKRAWRKFLTDVGRPVSEADLDFVLNGAKREEILTHFLGPLSKRQIAEYGRQKDTIFLKEAEHISTIRGLKEFLSELSAARIVRAVATSASQLRTERILEKLKLDRQFAAIVTGDDVPRGKPDPAIFQLVAERLGIAPGHLAVIEDAASGIRAARACGMKCVGISQAMGAHALCQAGAEIVARDFRALRLRELQSLFR
jgi:HAD superfamily hydrolase (TIGR01509 family)